MNDFDADDDSASEAELGGELSAVAEGLAIEGFGAKADLFGAEGRSPITRKSSNSLALDSLRHGRLQKENARSQ